MTPDNIYAELIEAVEQKLQHRVTTPRDFDFLSNEIQRTVHANISVSTLKRLWGYVNTESDYRPRMFTLDSLALLLGYQDYAAFLRQKDETASSYVCGKEGGIKYEIRRCNESNRGGDLIF